MNNTWHTKAATCLVVMFTPTHHTFVSRMLSLWLMLFRRSDQPICMQPICMGAQDAVFCDQAAAQQEGKATSPEQPKKEALLDRLKHMEVSKSCCYHRP